MYARRKTGGSRPCNNAPNLVMRCLHDPEFVSLAPEYRPESKHWTHAFAVMHAENPAQCIVVAVSLANFEGHEYEQHWLIAVHVARANQILDTRTGLPKLDKWKRA